MFKLICVFLLILTVTSCESQSSKNKSTSNSRIDLQSTSNIGNRRVFTQNSLSLKSNYNFTIAQTGNGDIFIPYEMKLSFNVIDSTQDIKSTISDFSSKAPAHQIAPFNEIYKTFFNTVEINYFVAENGFEVTNKKEVWNTYFDLLPEDIANQMRTAEKEDPKVFDKLGVLGEFTKFSSPIVQLQNISSKLNDTSTWKGYLHGEIYKLNNTLIPCEFKLIKIDSVNSNLITTINVDSLKILFKEKGLESYTSELANEKQVSSNSRIKGSQIELFEFHLPKLFPSFLDKMFVYRSY